MPSSADESPVARHVVSRRSALFLLFMACTLLLALSVFGGRPSTVQATTRAPTYPAEPFVVSEFTDIAARDRRAEPDEHASHTPWWRETTTCCRALRQLHASVAVLHPAAELLGAIVSMPGVNTVVEAGSRDGWLTAAIAAQPGTTSRHRRRYRSIAPKLPVTAASIFTCAQQCFGNHTLDPHPNPVLSGSPLSIDLPFASENSAGGAQPIDVYLTDTLHNGDNTVLELYRVSSLVRKFIIVAGTKSFSNRDESAVTAAVGWAKFARAAFPEQADLSRPDGAAQGVELFLNSSAGRAWYMHASFAVESGVTVLARRSTKGGTTKAPATGTRGNFRAAQSKLSGVNASTNTDATDLAAAACRFALSEVIAAHAHDNPRSGAVAPRQTCSVASAHRYASSGAATVAAYFDAVPSSGGAGPHLMPFISAHVAEGLRSAAVGVRGGETLVVEHWGCSASMELAMAKGIFDLDDVTRMRVAILVPDAFTNCSMLNANTGVRIMRTGHSAVVLVDGQHVCGRARQAARHARNSGTLLLYAADASALAGCEVLKTHFARSAVWTLDDAVLWVLSR
jgi:hypothetical protein